MKGYTIRLLDNIIINVTFYKANFTQNYGFINAMLFLHGSGHLTITDSVAVHNFGMLNGLAHFEDDSSFEFTDMTFKLNFGIRCQLLRISF